MNFQALVQKIAPAALLASLVLTSTGCDKVGPLILQSSEQTEQAYAELAKRWLEWTMGQPWSTGPVTDPTGEACGNDQQGKVWLLAGTSGGPVERDCTIPAHKALFFPLINRWVIPNIDGVDTPEEAAEWLAWAPGYFASKRASTCGLTLKIDGEDILEDTAALDAELYVEVLEPFEVFLDDDNWATQYGKPGGEYPFALVDGHYALLEPLEPGDHVLEFGGKTCNAQGVVTFETRATYNLHVEGHHGHGHGHGHDHDGDDGDHDHD
ncbi:hypothetical protein ACNOYE_22185 [Nannocystaceae bacterium ST9]